MSFFFLKEQACYLSCINSILLYSPKLSNRLQYILNTLLADGLGLSLRITTTEEEYATHRGPAINYSEKGLGHGIQILPHSILFDHGIRDYHLEVSSHPRFHKIFMKNAGQDLPFDLLGASFWLLSRYEEYLPHKSDGFDRFHYRSSLAYQYDFIQLPLVNLWLTEFSKLLGERYPEMVFKKHEYSFVSSIDVDNAYKYKYKGFVRTLAGIVSEPKWSSIRERFRIILNKARDPFDCYDYLIEVHKKEGTKALYFMLLGDYGPNDKNHSASDLRFQALIKHLADYAHMGIHPSFGSNNNLRQLKVEVSRLGNITHRLITKTRQHFAMLKFPKTYQDLLQAGLFADYSMGYTNYNGFRASYCFPYKWYSLDIESVSALTIHPFCISENTLLTQSKLQQKGLMELSLPILNEVKKYGGEMISIFHNDNFNEEIKQFYAVFIKEAGKTDQNG